MKLSTSDMENIRILRKKNPVKASKLMRRKKARLLKKKRMEYNRKDVHLCVRKNIEDAFESAKENRSKINELTHGIDINYIDDDLNETLGSLKNIAPDALEELKEIHQRFSSREKTRAMGKGEYNEDFNEAVHSNDTKFEERGDKRDPLEEQDDETELKNKTGLSKKKLKQLRRPPMPFLKRICSRPEVVESWDTTAPDPELLVYLKAYRNTIVVPGHWSHKTRYLQGKRGIEKSQFQLPHYIEETKISEIRSAIEASDAKKTLKQRMREKSRPRHRKMNIDYQTLYDAFFKYATKPPLTKFGDVYFEGKETEMHFRKYVPGKLSDKCREALGMTSTLDAPPWLLNMQRYGPPPSYPNLVVPGVNAHIPEGAALGFQPGGWGKPPTLEQLKIWGVTPRFEEVVLGEDDVEGLEGGGELAYWGALQVLESDEERVAEHDNPKMEIEDLSVEKLISGDGLASSILDNDTTSILGTQPTFLSGIKSSDISLGFNTPDSVDLKSSDFILESIKPYSVVETKRFSPQQLNNSIFSSEAYYGVQKDHKN